MNENKLTYIIYKHTDPNGKGYVGYTSLSLKERAGSSGINYIQDNGLFAKAIQEYGWDNFKHEILLTVSTKEMAMKAEEAMIIGYNTMWPNGYNNCIGYKHTAEHNNKISKARKGKYSGENAPMFGKHLSEETRRKLSISNRKPHLSARGRTPWNKGLHQTEETKAKRSLIMKQKHWFNNGEISVFQETCPDGFQSGRLSKKKK